MSPGCKFCTLLTATASLLCACSDRDADTDHRSASPNATDVEQSLPGNTETIATARRERLAALTEQLDRARADRAAAMLQRDSLSAQLESEQGRGQEMVAAVRAELSQVRKQAAADQSGARDSERTQSAVRRYEEDARVRLEDALAADEKLRAELDTLDDRVTELDSRIGAMHRELDSLRATDQAAQSSH
jgi:DNA repair exonuclease SbcCD ATPase subunit